MVQGWTALHFAAQNGNEATVELLLKGGDKYTKELAIDPNVESGADRSPLGVALSAGGADHSPQLERILVPFGI